MTARPDMEPTPYAAPSAPHAPQIAQDARAAVSEVGPVGECGAEKAPPTASAEALRAMALYREKQPIYEAQRRAWLKRLEVKRG